MSNVDKEFFKSLYQFCDDNFVELRALPSKRRQFIPVDSLFGLDEFCGNPDDNYYFGVALRIAGDGTKKGITQIPALHVDCDFKDTPRDILFEKIKQFPFKPSLIVKSGGGAHLYFILDEPVGHNQIGRVEDANRRIAAVLGGDLNACDASRILRIPGTVNIKYDPPRACQLTVSDNFAYNIDSFLEILPEFKTKNVKPKDVESNNWLSEAMGGVSEGNRNATAAKIAGYWINKLPPADVLSILEMWNLSNSPPLSNQDIQTVVKSVSRYEPDKPKSTDLTNVYDAKRMVEEYQNYLKNLKNNRFITGINEIDKRIRGVAGGEVLTIIARAGCFKTAMLQNMLKNYVQNSAWGAVFFSIEMPVASVAERYFEILDGCTGKEVETMFSEAGKFPGTLEASTDQFIKDLKNLFVIPTKISLSQIPKYIDLIQSEYNLKIGVIGIDYLGLIDGPGTNEYEITSRISRGSKDVAKLINLPVVLLSQVSRKGGEGQTEVTLDMGRGSGAIEEAADTILGLWQSDDDLICKILKNRKGRKGSKWKLELYPKSLTFGSNAERYFTEKQSKSYE